MDDRLQQLEREVAAIKERNARVEADKAWETSLTRSVIIMVITFAVSTVALNLIGDDRSIQNALIATLGFYLSIQSFSVVKKWWLAQRH